MRRLASVLGSVLVLATHAACGAAEDPVDASGDHSLTESATDPAAAKDGACAGSACAPPAPDDGKKNGDETDADCGGAKAPKCAVGKGCKTNADCASDACSYAGTCVEDRSCTGHFGGDTCGAGETGAADAKHESCCTRVSVDDRPAAQGGAFEIDKYLVTAGRMRAFVERYDGDLRSWATNEKPAGWNDAWTDELPSSMAEALAALGPEGKRGCNVASDGGRTYWQPPIGGAASEVSDLSKDVLDEKALNCVTWHMAQALCAQSGGRLATASEIAWVFENRGRAGGPTAYPWGFHDTSAYDPKLQDPRLAHHYNYETPNAPTTMRMASYGGPLDKAFYIAPPGRFPAGANMHGVEDAAGNMLVWVGDAAKTFSWTLSWEDHGKKLVAEPWKATDAPDGYYAIGLRCARSK